MEEKNTPMIRQYLDIKKNYSDYLLFYRMGDFYELFFDDAVKASKILNITLTKRGYSSEGKEIPMCGVPVISYENYLQKLIASGEKIAICEQTETPEEAKKLGKRGPLERTVTRIVTRGTITEDEVLPSTNNYLLAISDCDKKSTKRSIAVIDFSTGFFSVESFPSDELINQINFWNPSEILIKQSMLNEEETENYFRKIKEKITIIGDANFSHENAVNEIKEHYNIMYTKIFGDLSKNEEIACGVIIQYLKYTQCGQKINFGAPISRNNLKKLKIDFSTQKNLEIFESKNQMIDSSLFKLLNKTVTKFGLRLFKKMFIEPLIEIDLIEKRLDLIQFFYYQNELSKIVSSSLSQIKDIERILNRNSIGRSSNKDILLLLDSIIIGMEIISFLLNKNFEFFKLETFLNYYSSNSQKKCDENNQKSENNFEFENNPEKYNNSKLEESSSKFNFNKNKNKSNYENFLQNELNFDNLVSFLQNALTGDLKANLTTGGVIKDGFDDKLDYYRNLINNSNDEIKKIENEYIKLTKIPRLKISKNNISGFFIEVNNSYISRVPHEFIHKQTLSNVTRYSTKELDEISNEINEAFSKSIIIENVIFGEIIQIIENEKFRLQNFIKLLSEVDVFSSFGNLAFEKKFIRPEFSEKNILEIFDGVHPIVSEFVAKDEIFTKNDCILDDKKNFILLTGPNMAGKSTYLRQNAIIIIMAQVGLFVPAKSVKLGIHDKIFSRIGASDDLAGGQSTFMVEMIETATILRQATEKSFVILDEIGRGTSTYDGLAIAYAVTEYIHDEIKAKTIFATHYHELTDLTKKLKRIKNMQTEIIEHNEKIIFQHKIIDGISEKSYGLHVAELAGIPQKVIKKANELLFELEKK